MDSGQSVTLVFKDEIACFRGQIITNFEDDLEISDQFETTLFGWTSLILFLVDLITQKPSSQMISATVAEPSTS